MNVGRLARLMDVDLGSLRFGVEQVVHDGIVEQHCVLWNHTNVATDAVKLQVFEILTIDGDGAVRNVVEAEEKFQARRFATAGLAYDCRLRARGNSEADAVDNGLPDVALVGEIDIIEGDFSPWRG